jgi:hypothetical protein
MVMVSLLAGCGVQRTLTVNSNPSGALLYLNGTEIGRTPVTKEFTWYGTYDVELRREGYDTLKTPGKVIAPWWQWPPFDFFAELLPFRPHDKRHLNYVMQPTSPLAADPGVMVQRAGQMRTQLESSKHTREPAP